MRGRDFEVSSGGGKGAQPDHLDEGFDTIPALHGEPLMKEIVAQEQ
jgi:hypothetical protein